MKPRDTETFGPSITRAAWFGHRLAAAFTRWLRRRQTGRAMNGMTGHDAGRVAQDLAMDRCDLSPARVRPEAPQRLLPRMMRHLGIDPTTLCREERAALRDLERVCGQCPATGRCARALAAGEEVGVCLGFCYNATTLEALVRDRATVTPPMPDPDR